MRNNTDQIKRVASEYGVKCHESNKDYWKRRNAIFNAQGKHSSHNTRTDKQIMTNFTTYVPATITPPRG